MRNASDKQPNLIPKAPRNIRTKKPKLQKERNNSQAERNFFK